MNRLEKISVCLAGVLVLSASARAQNTASSDNPYSRIVERNVFGLNPLPPPGSDQPPADPPPKITPNGIMSIFGQLQVLFKVAVTKPGQAAKDEFYTLSEGEQQDDIEVTHIDEAGSMVTFNNHGIVQEIPLANAPAINTPNPSVPTWGAGGGGRFGGRFGGGPGGGPPGGMQNPNYSTAGGYNTPSTPSSSMPTSANNYASQITQLTQQSQNVPSAEEQMVILAAQHLKAQQDGSPTSIMYPKTPFDDEAGITSDTLPAVPDATPNTPRGSRR